MKFSINQSEFYNALQVVVRGSTTKTTLSILAGVYIKAEDGEVTIQTTNLELSIRVILPALVDEPGEVVAPAKLLTEILKSLPDVAVQLETQDNELHVFCNNSSFALKTLPAADFPSFPELLPTQSIQIPFSLFASMAKSTAKIVSRDETRMVLTGVLLEQNGQEFKMVATDSYRLAVAKTTIPGAEESSFEAVISGTFISDIASLKPSDDPIEIGLNENQIIITYQNVTFINRRVEGKYPNYKQLIADSYTTKVNVASSDIIKAVQRVSLLSSKVSPIVLTVDSESNIITVSSASQDVGSAQEQLVAQVDGEDIQIAFNYGFLLEALNSIGTPTTNIEFNGSMKPGILKVDSDDSFLHLVMPVRV